MVAFICKALNWRKITSMDEGPLPCCFACIVGREKITKIEYNKCLVYIMYTVFLKCIKHNIYLILAACGFHWAPWNSSEKSMKFQLSWIPVRMSSIKKNGKKKPKNTNYTEEKNLSQSQK